MEKDKTNQKKYEEPYRKVNEEFSEELDLDNDNSEIHYHFPKKNESLKKGNFPKSKQTKKEIDYNE